MLPDAVSPRPPRLSSWPTVLGQRVTDLRERSVCGVGIDPLSVGFIAVSLFPDVFGHLCSRKLFLGSLQRVANRTIFFDVVDLVFDG